jgi:hypothetical protein
MKYKLTTAEYKEDARHCTHFKTGAQALVKCVQRTHGMMLGDKIAVLVQRETPEGAEAEYFSMGRGDSAWQRGVKWLEENGFKPRV